MHKKPQFGEYFEGATAGPMAIVGIGMRFLLRVVPGETGLTSCFCFGRVRHGDFYEGLNSTYLFWFILSTVRKVVEKAVSRFQRRFEQYLSFLVYFKYCS
jgi:hypothetical protein